MKKTWFVGPAALFLLSALDGCAGGTSERPAATLTDAQVEDIVSRSYQYVAMYNVNNKFAMKHGGWNTVDADTGLKDHTTREIARPNNAGGLDLRPDRPAAGRSGLSIRRDVRWPADERHA